MPVRRRRVLIEPAEIFPEEVRFSSRNAHYVRDVLRLKPGDWLSAFDGRREYDIRLVRCGREAVIGQVAESLTCTEEPLLEMTLAFCCIRPGPVEEIVRHGTEIGVCRFVPILSQRANRKPAAKKQRWEAVIASAAAQSGRVRLPVVETPQLFEHFIERESTDDRRVLLTAGPGAETLLALLEETDPCRITLLVGPEGGFDPAETLKAVQAGFSKASLNPGVLRTETACIIGAGIAAMWHRWRRASATSARSGNVPGANSVLTDRTN